MSGPNRTSTGFAWKLGLAALVFAGFNWGMPGLEPDQRAIAAVFAFTVVLWATEAMSMAVTALLSTCLLILIAGIDPRTAFGAYGNPIIHLFIGSFVLAKGMEVTGLNRRLAWTFLKQPWATRSPAAVMLSMGVIVCVISSFVSNTATTAMMIPIVLTMLAALGVDKGVHPYAAGAMLMLTWSASVAVGTPVSTPPNMIGISLIEDATGHRFSFAQWAMFAVPVSVTMLGFAWLLVRLLFGRHAPSTGDAHGRALEEAQRLGRVTRGERIVMFAFGVAVFLWLAPDLTRWLLGPEHPVTVFCVERVTSAVAALIGAVLLFMLPDPSRESGRTITWGEARNIDWGTILLFGGGIALGDAMFRSGLAVRFGEAVVAATGANNVWGITLVMIVAAVTISELASNTASATTLVPVAIGLAEGAGVNPIIPAVATTIAASLGFMLPVSTAPNAIVYGTGLVSARQMMRAGILFDLIGILVVFGLMRLIMPLLGFY